ncbi:MAG: hypothetical protein GWP08_21830 [Nitrospiraceae bacterium]|nr:hypothetical protein [Nitrospiraceae bacterium]
MWRAKIVPFILLGFFLQVAVSCGAPEPAAVSESPTAAVAPAVPTADRRVVVVEPPAPTAENKAARAALLDKWLELAKNATSEAPVLDETAQIAQDLAGLCGGAPLELLDVMADTTHTPMVRVMASMSLRSVQDTAMIPRLIELTAADQDALTRACAVELLVFYKGAEVDKTLEALQHDPERRVQLTALCGLVMRDDSKRSALHEFWRKPDTTAEEKGRIVMTLAGGAASESLDLFLEAASNASIGASARRVAIQMVGQEGNAAHLPAMKALVEKNADDSIRQAALTAMAMIEMREKQAAAPTEPAS